MHKFDTIQGKLFYTVYMMHQQREIDTKQKGILKDLIIQKHPSMNKIKTDNTLITRRSLLDLADVEEDQKDEQKIEKNRPIIIRPILTNSKYKSNQSLLSSPQRK
ncbi:unnamed protein product [Paramecium pentaurelia]|uniref:Uncharacterized protein n=1 Tax=Paramecium pentaurelia TaxID=43138 RepID=A0A8S1TGX8_9CILI|nr:unnamed protein product [Paramecium pentaurelia]